MADDNTQATGGTTETPETEGTTQTAPAGQSGGTEWTYTQAEVDQLLGGYVEQSEVNRLVGEARRPCLHGADKHGGARIKQCARQGQVN